MAISEQQAELLVYLPECPLPLAVLYLRKALTDLLSKVDLAPVWLDELVINNGETQYDLALDQPGLKIKGIETVLLNGQSVENYSYADGALSFTSSSDGDLGCLSNGDTLVVGVAVEADGSGVIPDVLTGADHLMVPWALWHLLRIQRQDWFDLVLADDFRQEYQREFLLLKQNVVEQQTAFLSKYIAANGEDSALQQVLLQLPECPASIAKLQLKKAVQDAMDKVDLSSVWLVPLITQCGLRRYPLDFQQNGVQLQRIERVTLDGVDVHGFQRSGHEFILPSPPGDCQRVRVKVAIRADGSGKVPDSLRGFEQGLVAWALWHLLLMSNQEWFNPQLAGVFRQEYERDLVLFRQEAEEDKQADELQEQMAEMGRRPMMRNPAGFF